MYFSKLQRLCGIFGLTLGILISIVTFSNVVSANAQEELTKKIKFNDFFEVYEDNVLKYKGKNLQEFKRFINNNSNYRIGAYKNGELTEVIYVRSAKNVNDRKFKPNATNPKEKIMEEQILTSSLNAVITSNEVLLNWSNIEDEDNVFQVYRNGVLIGETVQNEFIDSNVITGTTYVYDVVSKINVDFTKREEILASLSQQGINISTLTEKQKQHLFSTDGYLTKIIEIPSINENSLLGYPLEISIKDKKNSPVASLSKAYGLATIPSVSSYTVRYTTFIPQKSVPDPYSLGNYLKGDNRSYSISSSAFRTRNNVKLTFSSTDPSMTFEPLVNSTNRCSDSACTDIIKTDTASSSNMKISKDTVSSSKMAWRVNHDIGIPFSAMYPNINYYYEATLTKTAFNISGAHDKAPAHEIYLLPSGKTTITIHQTTVDSEWDFGLLLPIMPQTYFNVSM